ncbi:MAG TPA: sugar phosphate nucleotidyltransferase [Vicinamibacteria bacterium]|nr:sugar phosphate nucleotidyltransferase [Vicinamibacteria bacterium]
MTKHLYTIILAAGEGTRVRGLTKNADGVCVPKQFSVVDGDQTILHSTLSRATRLVPNDRVVAVVAEEHRRWWREDLAGLPPENIVVQPLNRGTAIGLLLPFLKVLQRDPEARILVLPSDHHVDDEETLRRAILEALESVNLDATGVVLLGALPQEPDTEYGWIVPRGTLDSVRGVVTFIEKPDKATARTLLGQGALLNTLILVAAGRSLLHLYTRHLPGVLGELLTWRDNAMFPDRELTQLYSALPSHDLSRDVLTHSCDQLSVLPISHCGWSDLGTPARLRLFQREQASAYGAMRGGSLASSPR